MLSGTDQRKDFKVSKIGMKWEGSIAVGDISVNENSTQSNIN